MPRVPPRQLAATHGRRAPAALSRVRGVSDDRYARVYFDRIERDAKFDGIRNNRALYGSWLLLLQEAEKAWPSPAFVPPTSWVPRRDFLLFVERGILDMTTDGRFEMHGLDSIRAERSRHASSAAKARWSNAPGNAPSIADASAPSMPRQVQTSTDKTSTARAGLTSLTPTVSTAWERATGKTVLGSGEFASGYIDDACRRHPAAEVVMAILTGRATFERIPTTQQLTVAVRGILDPLPDAKQAQKAEAEGREATRSRRAVQATKRQAHETGWHADTPDPMCDACKAVA